MSKTKDKKTYKMNFIIPKPRKIDPSKAGLGYWKIKSLKSLKGKQNAKT